MGDIVNLIKARKQAVRPKHDQRAAENRIAHGRSKAARMLEQTRREQLAHIVDQHALEPASES
jgi:hypothetical protein